MLKSPAIALIHHETFLGSDYHQVWLIVRPVQAVIDALPAITATYDPPRIRERATRRAALRAALQPLLGDMSPRETVESSDTQGPRLQICLSGHRRMTERQAERYMRRWVWHHRRWATTSRLNGVLCPYWKRMGPRYRTLEIEHEKARRWDALQARKRRQREAKVSLNVPAGAQS